MNLDPGAALILVDVQVAFRDAAFWGPGLDPAARDNIAALVTSWESRGAPVVVVQHDSANPDSPLFPGSPGHALEEFVPQSPALHVRKSVNSTFHGSPDLAAWLRAEGITQFVIAGITTNHCCETTARVGGNLGFEVLFALDATGTFDRVGPDGQRFRAAELVAVTAANLHGEFATVVSTAQLLAESAARRTLER